MTSLRYSCVLMLLLCVGWNALAQVEASGYIDMRETRLSQSESDYPRPVEAAPFGRWGVAIQQNSEAPPKRAPRWTSRYLTSAWSVGSASDGSENAAAFPVSRIASWHPVPVAWNGNAGQTAPANSASNQNVDLNPVVQGPIVEKQKRIRARVHQKAVWELIVKTKDKGEEALQSRQATDENGGVLEFDLASLDEGVRTKLKELNAAGEAELSPGMSVFVRQSDTPTRTSAAVSVTANKVQVYLQAPREGDQVVKGKVIGTADQVRVEVFSQNRTLADFDTAAISSAPADKQSGKGFTAGMNKHLVAGQSIRVVALKDGEEIGASADYTLVETIGFNWGRVRAYFTLGATVAARETQTRDDAGVVTEVKREMDSADYYVAFNADYNWFSTLRDRYAFSCLRPAAAQEDLRQLQDLVDRWDSEREVSKQIGSVSFAKKSSGGAGITPNSDHVRARQHVVRVIQRITGEFQKVLSASISSLEAFQSGNGCSEMERARIRILKDFKDRYALVLYDLSAGYDSRRSKLRMFAQSNTDVIRFFNDQEGKLKTLELDQIREQTPVSLFGGVVGDFLEGQWDIGVEMDEGEIRQLIKEIASLNHELDKALEHYEESDPTNVPGGFLFNTSFEGRLAQAPATGVDEEAPNALSVFQNANTFYAGLDAYAPKILKGAAWSFNGVENALFIAPLARFSMLALPSGPVADEKNLIRDLYLSHSYGLRFGFFEFAPRRKTVAPELVSFLDITAGRFDNFRRPISPPTDDPGKNFEVPLRVEASGRFRIPQTPLYIGFSGNFGPHFDDVRVFFGTRFDIAKLLAKALPTQ